MVFTLQHPHEYHYPRLMCCIRIFSPRLSRTIRTSWVSDTNMSHSYKYIDSTKQGQDNFRLRRDGQPVSSPKG